MTVRIACQIRMQNQSKSYRITTYCLAFESVESTIVAKTIYKPDGPGHFRDKCDKVTHDHPYMAIYSFVAFVMVVVAYCKVLVVGEHTSAER